MKKLLGRLWIEWKIAISFLREGRVQSLMITVGVAVGVSVIVFISALIQGLAVQYHRQDFRNTGAYPFIVSR